MLDEPSLTLTIALSIIIPVTIIIIICVIAILVSVRNKKYRLFVLEHSEKIKNIKKLNDEFNFFQYKSTYQIYKRFDNKGTWYRSEPIAFLTKYLRDDLVEWFGLKRRIDYNREQYNIYCDRINEIDKAISYDVCLENNMNFKKAVSVERTLFDSYKLNPSTNITFNVRLRYVSPKGQVDESKTAKFDYVNFSRILDSVSQKRMDRTTYERLVSAERSVLTDSMRYDVLRRDNFRCVLCGMSREDGAILHVDHIIPVSKGGKTEMSNLRTLCERCNLGKSNKIE